MSQLTPVKNLWAGSINTKPINYDWSEGYAETWEYFEASVCEGCDLPVTNTRGGERHRDIDSDSECEGHVPSNEGPMMNYYYPLEKLQTSIEDAQIALIDLPLCIVEFQDSSENYALALTGGGMDLSWEICEAFMRLGYLPPLHFADLPRMSGRGVSRKDRWIIAGCRRSASIARGWAASTIKHLREISKAA